MDSTSFNLLLLNLFIGLVRNHKFYRPFSDQIAQSNYQIFGIERTFKCGVRDVTPEIMACSEEHQHTIMWEVTSLGGLNTAKQNQIQWYLRITADDLINSAGVPVPSSQSHSLWVVVTPDAAGAYEPILDWQRDCGLMLSSFSADAAGYSLNYCGGDISDGSLNQLFQNSLRTPRIYGGYVTVDTSNLGETALAKSVVAQFVSLVVKGELNIVPEAIAKRLIPEWSSYPVDKRVSVITGVKRVLRRFSNKAYTENMLSWSDIPNPHFAITLPVDKEIAASKAKLYRAAARYQAEVLGGVVQLDLDL